MEVKVPFYFVSKRLYHTCNYLQAAQWRVTQISCTNDYQFSNLTLKLLDAETTLMYRSPLAALTDVQPPPLLVIPCAPDVML
jgi:hypothetical protein